METKLVTDKPARANDAAIVSSLTRCAREGGGNTMVVGIRNDAGDIYRGVKTVGMGEFMAVVSALISLGLKDDLADAYDMKEGCDAIFR